VTVTGSGEVRLVALGGLGEFGLNSLLVECGGEALLVDAGSMFPPAEDVGVDTIVPDYRYLAERKGSLRAIVLTHGHEDHVGALPAALAAAPAPVHGTPFTLGLARRRLRERGLRPELRPLHPGESFEAGCFRVHAIRVAHSVLDSLALAIETPAGVIVHSGDFKLDRAAEADERTDIEALRSWGQRGVLALLSDSTNVESEGATAGESEVVPAFERIFAETPGRVLVSCFSSALPRIRTVSALAARSGRRLGFVGRRMNETLEVALELGRFALPAARLTPGEAAATPPDRLALFVAGSQGEPLSALSCVAAGDYRGLQAGPGDAVVLSARVIPGNERAVSRLISDFYRRGCEVHHPGTDRVHVSGHGAREDLLELLRAVRPRHLVPVHGEYRMLAQHARLAVRAGLRREAVVVAETGDAVRIDAAGARVDGRVPAGRVMLGHDASPLHASLVAERRLLAGRGIAVPVVVLDRTTRRLQAAPRILTRGVFDEATAAERHERAGRAVAAACENGPEAERADASLIRERVRSELSRFFRRERRRPLVEPVVVEI
jgi:ribonuclease J